MPRTRSARQLVLFAAGAAVSLTVALTLTLTNAAAKPAHAAKPPAITHTVNGVVFPTRWAQKNCTSRGGTAWMHTPGRCYVESLKSAQEEAAAVTPQDGKISTTCAKHGLLNPLYDIECAIAHTPPPTLKEQKANAQAEAAAYVDYWRTAWHSGLNHSADAKRWCAANEACYAAYDALSSKPITTPAG